MKERLTIFILVVLGIGLLASVYVIKAKSEGAREEAARLQKMLDQERAAIVVLKAEIAHLESPARLDALSAEFLDVEPTMPDSVLTQNQLGAILRANIVEGEAP